jgi:CMP-N,N'-diacetyllegionaminic acid synthase
MKNNDTLILVPARGGSKGVPDKNIKSLCGQPLIKYTLDVALQVAEKDAIFISTDSPGIKSCVEDLGFEVPVLRPSSLATDTSGMDEVIVHALDHFAQQGRIFQRVLLLQPTSPFRDPAKVAELLSMDVTGIDMIVSVKRMIKSNPYFTLFEENEEGYLSKSKSGTFLTRQETPPVYEYNGSMYLINSDSIRKNRISSFKKVRKFELDAIQSLDIDTNLDWIFCEAVIEKKLWK